MKLERVEVSGFRSFQDLCTIDFTTQPGVVNLTGRNLDFPELGANACGKSSLWEAVCWCGYGRTSDGLLGPAVLTWGKRDGFYVAIEFNGRRVQRSWSPNTLLLDGEDATQDDIDKAIGLTFEQFMACVFIAQSTPSFLDLNASQQTELLSSVLNLDVWLEYSAEAEKQAKRCAREMRSLEDDLLEFKTKIKTLEETDYRRLHRAWVNENTGLLVDIGEEIDAKRQALKKEQEARGRGKEDVSLGQKSLAGIEAKFEVALRKSSRTNHDLFNAEEQLKVAKTDVCPTCKQAIATHNPKMLHMVQQRVDLLTVDSREQEAEFNLIKKQLAVARRDLEDCEEYLRESGKVCDRIANKISDLQQRLSDAGKQVSPYAALVEEKESRLARLEGEIDATQELLDLTTIEYEQLTFWIKGFKDVRLFLVAEAMAQLEVEANSELMQLGLHGWSIEFAPDVETKSGTIKRGFSVLIKSPKSRKAVQFKSWSGGEKQRLRLAAQFGVSNLIASYTGFDAFIEVWDEPSNGMSEQGIADMLAAFSRRAEASGKQIWVVDHRALDSGVFTDVWVAVIENDSTTLQRS